MVMIIHGKDELRPGLIRACEEAGLEIGPERSSMGSLAWLMQQWHPPIVILGYFLPHAGDGERAAELIEREWPDTLVISCSDISTKFGDISFWTREIDSPLFVATLRAIGELVQASAESS